MNRASFENIPLYLQTNNCFYSFVYKPIYRNQIKPLKLDFIELTNKTNY